MISEPRIGYVNVFVSDFQRSLEFYRNSLELR
jgi:catechol 2,3-dioxygenase-like lactoylglutathione lyase family enzyme